MNAVFGGSTVLNFYYAAYSDNKRGTLNFMRNLNLAHILVIGGSWCSEVLIGESRFI